MKNNKNLKPITQEEYNMYTDYCDKIDVLEDDVKEYKMQKMKELAKEYDKEKINKIKTMILDEYALIRYKTVKKGTINSTIIYIIAMIIFPMIILSMTINVNGNYIGIPEGLMIGFGEIYFSLIMFFNIKHFNKYKKIKDKYKNIIRKEE